MSFDVPLHTRMLSLRVSWGEQGTVCVAGRIFDLRKRGIVPMGGKIQGPGVVHDMAADLELEYPSLSIRRVAPSMSAYPFAPGPATRGEGCPDRLPDVQGLVGQSLRGDYGTVLMDTVGGPHGCFHVFTLLRLLGPTVEAVVQREQAKDASAVSGRAAIPGRLLFGRSVIVDGFKGEGLSLRLRGTLVDLHYAPGSDSLPAQEALDESCEASADLTVALPAMLIAQITGRVRNSGEVSGPVGRWQDVTLLERLQGRPIQKGYTAEVQRLFSGSSGFEPLQHLLFMIAPTMMQCFSSLLEELDVQPRRSETPHAAVDSCHMWRADGPLVRDFKF